MQQLKLIVDRVLDCEIEYYPFILKTSYVSSTKEAARSKEVSAKDITISQIVPGNDSQLLKALKEFCSKNDNFSVAECISFAYLNGYAPTINDIEELKTEKYISVEILDKWLSKTYYHQDDVEQLCEFLHLYDIDNKKSLSQAQLKHILTNFGNQNKLSSDEVDVFFNKFCDFSENNILYENICYDLLNRPKPLEV